MKTELNVVPLHTPQSGIESTRLAQDCDVRGLFPGGTDVLEPIRFDNDRWDLAGHRSWHSKAGMQTAFSFHDIADCWRGAVKEWTLLCLNPELASTWAPNDSIAGTWPDAQEPTLPITVQTNLKALKSGLALLERYSLWEPTVDDWARVAELMRQPQNRSEKRIASQLAPGTLRMRAQQLRSLWMIRTIVGRPSLLGEHPFGDVETTYLFGSGPKPRRNSRRPHNDVGLCLGMTTWVFDNIASDIVAHARWWADNSVPVDEKPSSRDDGYSAMVALLDEVVTQRGVLPGVYNTHGDITLAHGPLATLLGEHDSDEAYLWGRYAMRRFQNVDLDLEGGDPCPLPIKQLPLIDGSGVISWTARLLNSRTELRWWASALVYYAMFYIAATCGLRDLDLACLPLDCVRFTKETRPTGEEYEVITMRGYRQKNRMAPIPTTWKVNARLGKIVRMIQELHEIYEVIPSINSATMEPMLFDSALITASLRTSRASVHLDLSFMDWIIKGARRLYDRGVTNMHLDDVTKLSVATIRITALQAYASRPLGAALVAQFGKWSTQNVAMGYHGDVFKLIQLADPDEASDLIQEHTARTLLRAQENFLELKGNGVVRLGKLIEGQGEVLQNPGPLSLARLKTLGKKNPNLRTGPYTLCLYDQSTALCGGRGAADFRLCRPFECRNSAMTQAHRAKIELRRRQELQMAPILRRDAEKIGKAMPEVIEEFSGTPDDELIAIVAADLESYVAEALAGEGGESGE
ncbi:hypothetical protein [Ferrimicrobium acidiphilum]|uniref:hypothetical protein n=2 Tax=Ferrimicrobium TaxID=121038 RepID=UPI0023F46C09|nr:hypothetical protein [Ferrimicrobium acidiphilum]MCL5052532.1 hypothetical protein [Gammaproteobacteria bacterium]